MKRLFPHTCRVCLFCLWGVVFWKLSYSFLLLLPLGRNNTKTSLAFNNWIDQVAYSCNAALIYEYAIKPMTSLRILKFNWSVFSISRLQARLLLLKLLLYPTPDLNLEIVKLKLHIVILLVLICQYNVVYLFYTIR